MIDIVFRCVTITGKNCPYFSGIEKDADLCISYNSGRCMNINYQLEALKEREALLKTDFRLRKQMFKGDKND